MKNKKAILYIRVSTDEQNDGYSPADQKERLVKYCEQNNIDIVNIYHEDESGKTFNRPEWFKIISYLKKNRGVIDVMLFIKWDRFSRNIAEAYIAIKQLHILGVEPQAIEQPLNFEIPEQKLMLAIYLAAPEVDNDRRALNIFHGSRRAKKEGRWLGGCLRGYKNARDEHNKPVVIPENGKMETFVKESFELFATGNYNMEELRRIMNKRGFKISRNSFWMMLRNKGYLGKVMLKAYKDEPEQWVQGLHQPLIDEKTFYDVQDILSGRKRKMAPKYITQRDEFPLRGFLKCPRCNSHLTGSPSKSRSGAKHYYYHCKKGCKERQRAETINGSFAELMASFKLNAQTAELYKTVLKKLLQGNNESNKQELTNVLRDKEKQSQRLKNARELMLDGEISTTDYKQMKGDIEESLTRLSIEENSLRHNAIDYTPQINFSVNFLCNIDSYYHLATIEGKQRIIGSIFPDKLVFHENKYRTTEINSIIWLLQRENNQKKEGKQMFSNLLSLRVDPQGVEPWSK
jgi:site-specific DNA recombinase